MNRHVHRVATLVVIDLYVVEVSTEAGEFFCLYGNATGAATIDCNRACIAGEHERRTFADLECFDWLGSTVSKGPSETEAESEQGSNKRSYRTENQDDDECN